MSVGGALIISRVIVRAKSCTPRCQAVYARFPAQVWMGALMGYTFSIVPAHSPKGGDRRGLEAAQRESHTRERYVGQA